MAPDRVKGGKNVEMYSENCPHRGGLSRDKDWRGNGTILVIDDEEIIRRLHKAVLERWGFRVLTAVDGREGVELFRQHQDDIACILLDLVMPHMSGEETFRELRRLKDGIRVIIVSGCCSKEDVRGLLAEKGIVGFLQKPYQVQRLIEAVRGVVEPGDAP